MIFVRFTIHCRRQQGHRYSLNISETSGDKYTFWTADQGPPKQAVVNVICDDSKQQNPLTIELANLRYE